MAREGHQAGNEPDRLTPKPPERSEDLSFSNVFPDKAEPPAKAPRGAQIRVPLTYSCGGCDNRWSGSTRAHCRGCHRTFSVASLFDMHRRDVKGVCTCIDPATIVVVSKKSARLGQPLMRFKDRLWRSFAEWDASMLDSQVAIPPAEVSS